MSYIFVKKKWHIPGGSFSNAIDTTGITSTKYHFELLKSHLNSSRLIICCPHQHPTLPLNSLELEHCGISAPSGRIGV